MDFKSEIKPFQVCRTCLEEILTSSFFYLDSTQPDTQLTIKQKLSYCMPELDLNIASNSIICDKCAESINSVYDLKNKCLQSELQIHKYMQQVQHTDDIDLAAVVCFHQSYRCINLSELKTEVLEIEANKIEEATSAVCNANPSETEEYTQPIKQEYLPECIAFDVNESYIDYSALAVEENSDTYYNSSNSVSQVDCIQNLNMGKIRGKWKESNMVLAVSKVRNNEMKIREASERYSVPKSTLGDRLKALTAGQQTVLKPCMGSKGAFQRTFSNEQEIMLHNHIKNLDNQLMPLNKKEFLKLAYQFAEQLKINHCFNKTKKQAGKDFYYNFMRRHRDLSLRTAASTSLQRAAGFNKDQVDRFYIKLVCLMEKYAFSPSKIFNANEVVVSCVHINQLKVLSVKGKKQVGKLTSGERGKNVTVLLAINASGDQFIPPLFVFPCVRLDNDLKKDAPLGSIFDAQPSGWITKEGFLKWMESFVQRINPSEKSPVLLIVDGHASHKDLDVILFAKKHHVHMLSLPPHTTHKMQPLGRVVMKPFKNAYNEACSLWMRKHSNLKIGLKDIAGLVNSAWSRICRMELAQLAFSCTGIYPVNPNVFSDLDFNASLCEPSQAVGQVSPNEDNANQTSPNEDKAGTSSNLTRSSPGPSNLAIHQQQFPPSTSISVLAEVLSSPQRQDERLSSTPTPSTPSTSTLSTSQTILEELSLLPSNASVKFNIRKRRGEQSEVLTSTPYKVQLEEKRKRLEDNEKKVTAKKNKNNKSKKTKKQRNQ